MKNLSKNEKLYLAIYLGWAFLHLVFLVIGWKGNYHSNGFWPFLQVGNNEIHNIYDLSEFLVYAGTPAVAFFIYRLINNDGVK